MSFGWSAGDIATAISVTYKLIQALDDAHGAANNYREAVDFLRALLRVLEPLQAAPAFSAYPIYAAEIKTQLGNIRQPVEGFLAAVLNYESYLGGKATKGCRTSLRTTYRKLDWYIFMEKRVLSLRTKIESHMRILDTLMQRLTLDMVWKGQQELPEQLRSTFQETVQPSLLLAIQECIERKVQGCTPAADTNHESIMTKLSEQNQLIRSAVEDMKEKLSRPEVIQHRIKAEVFAKRGYRSHKTLPGARKSTELHHETQHQTLQMGLSQQEVVSNLESDDESVSEICYLILLYFLQFVKSLLFSLSRAVKPSKALMPTLLTKYNITFLDAIGRMPRILPYEYFRSFKILQAFIEHEFKDLPGSSMIMRGRYLVLSLSNNKTLDEKNWNQAVLPGAKIAMSMLMRKPFESPGNTDEEKCPESNCSGTWTRLESRSWRTCPVCHREVFTSVNLLQESEAENGNETENHTTEKRDIPSAELSRGSDEVSWDKKHQYNNYQSDSDSDSEEKNITFFRRITRVVLKIRSNLKAIRKGSGSSLYEELDGRFIVASSRNMNQFWRIGRVFETLWTERAGPGKEARIASQRTLVSLRSEAVASYIRRFVVIENNWGSSLCVAIHTYGGRQATLKYNLPDPDNHAIIYTTSTAPECLSLQDRNGTIVRGTLSKKPIRVVREANGNRDHLDPASRINYTRVYTVEHNCRIANIGMVDEDSLPILLRDSGLAARQSGDVHLGYSKK